MSQDDLILRRILPAVTRPARYIGGDFNRCGPPPAAGTALRFLLVFPDTYEIGMSNLGLQILYHILCAEPDVLVDRVFAPWPDMEQRLRAEGVGLRSLDHGLPLADFDVIGISLQYELNYTNILTVLDLGGVALESGARGHGEPFVIGGGPGASNPEPIAPVFDALLLGDGEPALPEILAVFRAARAAGEAREETLARLARIGGMYVPRFFEPTYDPEGRFEGLRVDRRQPQLAVVRRVLRDLEGAPYPTRPLVPLSRVVHDRVNIEVARGCQHLCRFCPSSITSKPVRRRSPERVLALARETLANTGHGEVSLTAFNITDYPHLESVVAELIRWGEEHKVAVSIPSLRPGGITRELAGLIQRARKTGFTTAPEAGSARLRAIINKNISEQDLLSSAAHAFAMGWQLIKLYFMAGLPTETDADLREIQRLCRRVLKLGRRIIGPAARVNVSVSFFVPKPHTPFQWLGQAPLEELERKRALLSKLLRDRRIRFKPSDPRMSFLEAVFARGDRRLWPVLRRAWEAGCRFDGWSETFRLEPWLAAFEAEGIDPHALAQAELDPERPLPWEHLLPSSRREHLRQDYLRCRALMAHPYPDAAEEEPSPELALPTAPKRFEPRRRGARRQPMLLRLVYSLEGPPRFLSHLDVMRLFFLALRRAGLPMAYSQGFSPHPRVSYGPPLAVGFESLAEYIDLRLTARRPVDEVIQALNQELPAGLRVHRGRYLPLSSPGIQQLARSVAYSILVPLDEQPGLFTLDAAACARRLALPELPAQEENGLTIVRQEITELPGHGVQTTLVSSIENGRMLRPDAWAGTRLGLDSRAQAALQVTRLGLFLDREGRRALL